MSGMTQHRKVVLISGCSSGFGLEFALAFARRGDAVIATMRDLERSAELRQRMSAEGLRTVEVVRLDLNDPESLASVVDDVAARHGGVDVLINNAGRSEVGPTEALDLEALRGIFDTNVIGAVALTQAVLPHMRQKNSGRIIFVSALGAVINSPWLGAYCGSKHAIDSMAAVLDLEVRPLGIRVSTIVPAAFRTNMTEHLADPDTVADAYRERVATFAAGFKRRVDSSTDLRPVVDVLLEVVDAADPPLRRLVAPGKEDVFGPLVDALNDRHAEDVAVHC